MASKPASTPRWADVGGDIVEPTSGKKDIGHVPAEKPPAQHLNWFKNLVWQWLEYLSDGALEGDHTIDGNLGITGVYHRATALARPIPAILGAIVDGTVTLFEDQVLLGSSDAVFQNFVPVTEGEQINGVTLRVGPSTGTTQVMKLWKCAPTGARAQLGATQTQVGDDTEVVLSITGLTETVPGDGTYYYMESSLTAGSVGGIMRAGTVTTIIPP